jgi:small subunit ribosomal protein S6
MPLYETVFISRQDISGAQAEGLVETFSNLISEQGGSVAKNEYWGLKSLAFRMDKNRKGHYALMNIDAPAPAIAEMERQMRLHEDVLRYLTIRVEEHDEEPSPMMRTRGGREGREDRPRRDDDSRSNKGDSK